MTSFSKPTIAAAVALLAANASAAFGDAPEGIFDLNVLYTASMARLQTGTKVEHQEKKKETDFKISIKDCRNPKIAITKGTDDYAEALSRFVLLINSQVAPTNPEKATALAALCKKLEDPLQVVTLGLAAFSDLDNKEAYRILEIGMYDTSNSRFPKFPAKLNLEGFKNKSVPFTGDYKATLIGLVEGLNYGIDATAKGKDLHYSVNSWEATVYAGISKHCATQRELFLVISALTPEAAAVAQCVRLEVNRTGSFRKQ